MTNPNLPDAAGAPLSDPAAQFLHGSELAANGRMDEAEAAMASAVLLAPDFHIARYQLGLLQFSGGRASVALLTWQPLLSLPQTEALPHFVLGFAALAQDNMASARAHFHTGLATRPDNAALAGDIHKVLERMDGVSQPTSDPSTVPAAAGPEAASVDTQASQFLIANYGKVGTLH